MIQVSKEIPIIFINSDEVNSIIIDVHNSLLGIGRRYGVDRFHFLGSENIVTLNCVDIVKNKFLNKNTGMVICNIYNETHQEVYRFDFNACLITEQLDYIEVGLVCTKIEILFESVKG